MGWHFGAIVRLVCFSDHKRNAGLNSSPLQVYKTGWEIETRKRTAPSPQGWGLRFGVLATHACKTRNGYRN